MFVMQKIKQGTRNFSIFSGGKWGVMRGVMGWSVSSPDLCIEFLDWSSSPPVPQSKAVLGDWT